MLGAVSQICNRWCAGLDCIDLMCCIHTDLGKDRGCFCKQSSTEDIESCNGCDTGYFRTCDNAFLRRYSLGLHPVFLFKNNWFVMGGSCDNKDCRAQESQYACI